MPSSAEGPAGVRVFTPENRLSKILTNPDAPTKAQLVDAAQTNVDGMAEQMRSYVDANVQRLLSSGAVSEDALRERSGVIELSAQRVAEVAGAAGLTTVGEIARGIAAMYEGLRRTGVWHGEALMVHISSLALVTRSGKALGAAESAMILERLALMRRSVGVTE